MLFKLQQILQPAVKKITRSKGYQAYKIYSLWTNLIGEEMRQKTRAYKFEAGTLFIATSSSAWSHQLSLMQAELLELLNRNLPGRDIKRLTFTANLSRFKDLPEDRHAGQIEAFLDHITLTPEELEAIEQQSQTVTDSKLREAYTHILIKAKKSEHWKLKAGWKPCKECGSLSPQEVCPYCRKRL